MFFLRNTNDRTTMKYVSTVPNAAAFTSQVRAPEPSQACEGGDESNEQDSVAWSLVFRDLSEESRHHLGVSQRVQATSASIEESVPACQYTTDSAYDADLAPNRAAESIGHGIPQQVWLLQL